MKNKISELKNILEGMNSILDTTKIKDKWTGRPINKIYPKSMNYREIKEINKQHGYIQKTSA